LWTAFDQRLKELGYTDGENLGVEFVDLNGPISNQSEAMRELIGRKADILMRLVLKSPSSRPWGLRTTCQS
jgi:hypothetical protein